VGSRVLWRLALTGVVGVVGPGLWHSGICEAILEATRLTYEGANLTRPRASPHCVPAAE
jgi:hypothetical protein